MIRVPIQTSFGRRPVLLASTLICLASNIWRAEAQTYRSFMGACVLNGIGAGPAEVRNIPASLRLMTKCLQTAQPTIIADVMFLHERGAYNTLYFTFYFGSLMVSPTHLTDYPKSKGFRSALSFLVPCHSTVTGVTSGGSTSRFMALSLCCSSPSSPRPSGTECTPKSYSRPQALRTRKSMSRITNCPPQTTPRNQQPRNLKKP